MYHKRWALHLPNFVNILQLSKTLVTQIGSNHTIRDLFERHLYYVQSHTNT